MPKKFKPDREPERSKKLAVIGIALSLVIVSLAGLVMWWEQLIPEDHEHEEIPDFAYGNDTIKVTYAPDVKLITPEPEEQEGEGVEPCAVAVAFSDGFESGDFDDWDLASTNAAVTSTNPSSGSYSCRFNPTTMSTEYIKKEDIELCDADVNLEFDAYIGTNFVFGQADIMFFQHYDYFVVKLKFEGGNTLVYVVGGSYVGNPGEAVIDVRHQVDSKEAWANIDINDIQDDYVAQFEEEMPDTVDLKFYVNSKFGIVYIDDVYLDCETPPPEPIVRNYWELDEQEVLAYFILVEYEVDISTDVNESNVYIEMKIWVTIESNNESKIEDEELIQNPVIKVESFDTKINWTSATFSLPEDNSDGDELTYSFDIWVSAFGQIENTSYWVEDNGKEEGFDSFTITWVDQEIWLMGTIIVGVVSGIGIVSTAVAVKLHKKKKKGLIDCDCKGEPDCKCDI